MIVNLKRVLKQAGPILQELGDRLNTPVQVWDQNQNLLFGDPDTVVDHTYPIQVGTEVIGQVTGPAEASILATLLSYLCDRELEVKTLAADSLDKYREINLLYNLSEKLNVSLETAVVAQTVLTEARRLIPAAIATIILRDQPPGELQLETLLTDGDRSLAEAIHQATQGIATAVVEAARGEIVNQASLDPRYQAGPVVISCLLCVPLKTENGVIGILNLCHQEPIEYTAQHLKLLTTVASQAAQAIENARFYQQQLAAAQEREALLQQQLQDLRLAVEEAQRSQQLTEITETEYFQQLQQRAGHLRRRRSSPHET